MLNPLSYLGYDMSIRWRSLATTLCLNEARLMVDR